MRVALLTPLGEDVSSRDGEAGALAAFRRLIDRGLDVLVLARRPSVAHAVLGGHVEVARGLEFPHEPADRARYLDEISAVLAGDHSVLPGEDQIFVLISLLRSVDALVVSGVALDSPTGWLLYERVAAARIARALGLPVVITGLGLGPFLSRVDTGVLRELLAEAALVGVRDEPSYALAQRLVPGHPRIRRCLDDSALPGGGPSDVTPARVVIAVSDSERAIVAGFGEVIGRSVGAASPLWITDDTRAAQASALAGAAAVVVTSHRDILHAGLAGGAAVVALAPDHPSEQRLRSILADWGMQDAPIPLATVACATSDSGTWQRIVERVERSLHAQQAATKDRANRSAALKEAQERWWDAVVGSLRGMAVQEPLLPRDSRPQPASTSPSPVVAVLMRTRDRPLLLERALEDVLAQTFNDWHLVVVNDGGDPATVTTMVTAREDRFAGRITVVHHETSLGMEAASNSGLRAVDSPYVVVHDDDDTWHPDFLDVTVGHLDGTPTDQGVMTRTEIVYERIDGAAIVEEGRELFWADLQAVTLHDMVKINRAVPISFLYRRSAHETIGPYDTHLPAVGDWAFHLRFLTAFTVGFIDGAPLAFWHQRPGQRGEAGNSVFKTAAEHRKFDLLLREAYFKDWVTSNGLGLPLYLTKMTEREVESLAVRLEDMAREHTNTFQGLSAQVDHVAAAVAAQQALLERFEASFAGRIESALRNRGLIGLARRWYGRLRRL